MKIRAYHLTIIVAIFPTALLLLQCELFVRHGYVCNKTGSQYGYTEWPLGIKSDEWHYESLVESHLIESGITIDKDYESYMGTGYNILFDAMKFSHGSPRKLAMGIRNYETSCLKHGVSPLVKTVIRMLLEHEENDRDNLEVLYDHFRAESERQANPQRRPSRDHKSVQPSITSGNSRHAASADD